MREVASGPNMSIFEDRNLKTIDEVMENGGRANCVVCGEPLEDEPCLMLFSMNDLAVTDLIATVGIHPKCLENLGEARKMFTVHSEIVRQNMLNSMRQAAELGMLGFDDGAPVV